MPVKDLYIYESGRQRCLQNMTSA